MLNKWHQRTAILKILILQTVLLGTFYSKDNAKAVQPNQVIQGWGNKCLDVVNNEGKGPRNGTPVVIWDCYGSENQKWQMNSDGTIKGWGDKCLDVANGEGKAKATDGMQIVIWDCHGAANQRWKLNPDGTITGWDGKCLDVANPDAQKDPTSGMFVVLWHCHRAANQRWQINKYVAQCINAKIDTNIKLLSRKGEREDKVERIFKNLVECNSLAVPQLTKTLEDVDKDVRMVAIAVLGSIGSDASRAIPSLIKSFKDNDENVRFSSATALGYVGDSARPVVPMLRVAMLQDPNGDVRSSAAWVAAALDKGIVPYLIRSLRNPEQTTRLRVVEALGNIGKLAESAIPSLQSIARIDKNENIRSSANSAISKIRAEISRPTTVISVKPRVAVYVPPNRLVYNPKKSWICVIPFLKAAPKCKGK